MVWPMVWLLGWVIRTLISQRKTINTFQTFHFKLRASLRTSGKGNRNSICTTSRARTKVLLRSYSWVDYVFPKYFCETGKSDAAHVSGWQLSTSRCLIFSVSAAFPRSSGSFLKFIASHFSLRLFSRHKLLPPENYCLENNAMNINLFELPST